MIGLCTDSNAQLPSELTDRYGVEVVPLTVTIDGQDFLEGVDLNPDQFYERLEHGVTEVSTAAPPPGRFALASLPRCEEPTRASSCVALRARPCQGGQPEQRAATSAHRPRAARPGDGRLARQPKQVGTFTNDTPRSPNRGVSEGGSYGYGVLDGGCCAKTAAAFIAFL